MKKVQMLSMLALIAVITIAAQKIINETGKKIEVQSVTQIESTSAGGYFYPKFGPSGDYLLTTSENYAGLKMYDLKSKSFKTINEDAGAGYNPQISEDGQTILFRKTSFVQNRKMNALQSYSLTTSKQTQVLAPTREQITPQFSVNKPTYITGRNLVSPNVSASELKPVVVIENQKMVLYGSNGRKELSPNGAELSYYWPAISPDGQKIVYTVAGKGTFVCNIDGSQVKSLGKLNAPQWIDNTWIVGMDDKDDGQDVIESSLIAVTVDGKSREELFVPAGVFPMYPSVSKDGKNIVFNTPQGVLYLLQININ